MENEAQYYFGYGSNLNIEDFDQWCIQKGYPAGCLKPIREAILPDYKLAFSHNSTSRGGGALNLERDLGGAVEGVLFEVLGREGWNALDRKEGAPNCYQRLRVEINSKDGNLVPAITYINHEVSGRYVKPAQGYVELVQQGLRSFDLNEAALIRAARNSAALPYSTAVFVYDDFMRGQGNFKSLQQFNIKYIASGECSGELWLSAKDYPVMQNSFHSASKHMNLVQGEFVRLENIKGSLQFLDHFYSQVEMKDSGVSLKRQLLDICIGGRKVRAAWVYKVHMKRDEWFAVPSGCWRSHIGVKQCFLEKLCAAHSHAFESSALNILQRLNPWDALRKPTREESKFDYLLEQVQSGAIDELRLLQASGQDVAVW